MIDETSREPFFSKASLRIKLLIATYPKLYLALTTLFALLGLSYLLSFPILTLVAGYKLVSLAPQYLNPELWPIMGAWTVCLLVCSLVSYSILTIKVPQPKGLKLHSDKTKELFQLIDELQARHTQVKFDNIILTDEHKIEIIKTPAFGIPVWNKNTLAIGLPVLINLSEQQFKATLMRKFYQFSNANISITNWLVWLRQNWVQYKEAYSINRKPGHLPLSLFLRFYTPKFNKFSALAVRMDELKADSYSLNELNDEELLDMIQSEFVCKSFLENTYWPKIRSFVRKSPTANIYPHRKMAMLLSKGLPMKNAMNLLASAYIKTDISDNANPTLKARMENIGHSKIMMPTEIKHNAAQTYLGDSYNAYIKVIDKTWMSTTLIKWKKEDKIQRQIFSKLKALRDKACASRLSYKEMWQFAQLNKKLYGKESAIAFKNILLKKLPHAA
jgi:hypothetical protein